jgi:hydroxymethylglutaryl-CoA lyase
VPNLRGLDGALAVGCDDISIFGAASEAFTAKNINCTIAESLERFAEVCKVAKELVIWGIVKNARVKMSEKSMCEKQKHVKKKAVVTFFFLPLILIVKFTISHCLFPRNSLRVRGYVSCALHCPYTGPTSPKEVARVAERLLDMGCYEVCRIFYSQFFWRFFVLDIACDPFSCSFD